MPDGRAGRRIIVVDDEKTTTAAIADQFIELQVDDDLATIASMRALVKGASTSLACSSGGQRTLLRRCRTAVMESSVLARAFAEQPAARQVVESMFELVRELNEHTRFVAQVMGGPASGEVITWQTGYPMAVSFAARISSVWSGRILSGEAGRAR